MKKLIEVINENKPHEITISKNFNYIVKDMDIIEFQNNYKHLYNEYVSSYHMTSERFINIFLLDITIEKTNKINLSSFYGVAGDKTFKYYQNEIEALKEDLIYIEDELCNLRDDLLNMLSDNYETINIKEIIRRIENIL